MLKSALLSKFRWIAGAVLLLATAASHAVDFKTVGANPVILYDAPSERGRKVFVAPRGMPVEIVLNYGQWTKVRDAAGDLSWVEAKALSPKRTVVVKSANARVHSGSDENSPVVLIAERSVMLDLLEPAVSAWVRVRHRDGQSGFVRAADVWGD